MARKRTILTTLCGLILLAALGAGGVLWRTAWQEEQFLTVPPETPGADVVFRVEPGEYFTTIARNLKKRKVITDTRRFLLLAKRQGKTSSVRAGEFLLSTGWVPEKVLHELTTSAGIMKKVPVREGLTWWQTAAIVEEAGIGTHASFAAAAKDQELLRSHGIFAKNAEGYLFPETYLLTPPRSDQARHMVETMLTEFRRNAAKVWPEGLPEFKELHRMVILASLVEKETGDKTERARIAGVFHNRLQKRMLIQCDPTVIYGLGPEFDGNIRKSDLLDRENTYNTYLYPGLPPGPICSPGVDALMAAVTPEKHAFLYFVAKGDGSHHFSRTLDEHNKAVAKYQLRRNRKTYRSTKE